MRYWLISCLFILSMACLSCNREGNQDGSNTGTRIALVLKTLNSPFFVDLRNGAEAAADSAKVKLIVQAPEREIDVEKQMQIIENLIQIQVDAICVTPSGSRELIPALLKANQAGIPVLIVDTKLDKAAAQKAGVQTLTFIGSDNYEGGRIAGKHMAELFDGQASLAVIEGVPGHETGDSRLRGFRDGIRNFPGLKIIASQPANWERDQSYNVMQNILQSHPGIQAVFCCNDVMALGAMEAVAAMGLTESIKIIGFDAINEAKKEIQKGRIQASIVQYPLEMGRLAVENAIKVIKGKSIPTYIPVKIELITKVSTNLVQDKNDKK